MAFCLQMKYHIQTLGCAMNYSDSERVSTILEKLGYEKASLPEDTDLYIFNSCSIRQKGEDRVYGMMHNLAQWKKKNPRLLVALTGCMTRLTSTRNSKKKDPLLHKIETLDIVFRNTDLHKLGQLIQEAEPKLDFAGLEEESLTDYLKVEPKYTNKFLAYVPIQTGCDKYCTYCIVPFARGREKSRPLVDIYEECEKLVERGCKEITLGGQTVNSYGKSLTDRQNPDFAALERDPFIVLLEKIDSLKKKGLARLRYTSPHPYDMTDELIELHEKLPTLTTHFHIPVQAGDNDVLKKMNRRYTAENYTKMIEKIRAMMPNASVTTDIIVGFCDESPEQFEKTYELYKKIRWDMAYIARYSPRPGTVSHKAFPDNVPREEKAARWHRLNAILEECAFEYHNSLVGRELEVLVDSFNQETSEFEGRSIENKVVQFLGKAEEDLIGNLVKIKATKALQWLVKGEKVA